MKQYIDKSALVAELDKLYNLEYDNTSDLSCGKKIMLRDILLFLNTLEVKDVNCDKEIGMYTTKELLWKRNKATNVFHLTQGDIDRIAKHFFELGLKTQKGE